MTVNRQVELQPIRLSNNVTIDWPVALAPMAGVTDAVFRGLCRDHGCGYATTEFARDRALLMGVPQQLALIDIETDVRPVGVQIFGADPDEMRRGAALVVERVAPDVLDINMGCPAPKVTNGQGGSSLLKEPARAAAITAAIVREIAPVPVTVKIRVGWDELHKAAGAAVEVARRVVDAGAQLITVHGRTRQQKYEGEACWDTISAVAAAVPVPVLGNGDISTPLEAAHRLRTSGCRGIAIGRGARGRPWLFAHIKTHLQGQPPPPEPPPSQRIAIGLEHVRRQRAAAIAYLRQNPTWAARPETELLREADRRAVGGLLPHVMWYVWGIPGVTAVRRVLSRARTATQMAEILTDFEAHQHLYAAADRAAGRTDADDAPPGSADTCALAWSRST
ncbi:MAG TPA: tRNA-dihydrouridine synthase [Chloroflexota bacterium]|nr:tRNA-dihydrouridine synthase [Chloroflexota bacterium]